MTIEELLDCSAAKLAAMSDAELEEHFKPYLTITRPELAPKPIKGVRIMQHNDPKKALAMQLLAGFGVDLSDL
jgi:hypothetical protein